MEQEGILHILFLWDQLHLSERHFRPSFDHLPYISIFIFSRSSHLAKMHKTDTNRIRRTGLGFSFLKVCLFSFFFDFPEEMGPSL